MTTIDASEVLTRLWVGAMPKGHDLSEKGFSHLVLCAEEYQPDVAHFPRVTVLRCPFEDHDAIVPNRTIDLVMMTARAVAEAHGRGGKVLVTCAQGINRSALVAALSMQMLGVAAESSVFQIRKNRFPYCLSNTSFLRLALGADRRAGVYDRKPAEVVAKSSSARERR